jgi:zinc protease
MKNRSRPSALLSTFLCVFWCLGSSVSAQVRNWPSEGPPRPLAAREVKFPPYELRTLPNGLQVVAVLHHEQPAISMRLLIRAGSASDPKEKLGLAHLAAALLDQGTEDKSALALADAIDFIGGAESTGAGTDLSYLNMVVMKDSFDTGMRMLSDMARRPAFSQSEIDRQRQQVLSGLRVSQDDPSYIADAVFDRLVYGFHPYGLPQTGTPDTIASVTRDDIVVFHRRNFVPNNAILAVVGDVTAQEAFDEAAKVFGDWERRNVAADPAIDPPDPTRRVIVVDKPEAVQTEVRVGHLGVPRKSSDYMALNLAIRILGGEGSNRLHQVLRTERGLTYGAQADMDTLKQSGDFEVQTNTRSEQTGEVLRLIVDEFWRLQRERVSEHELADAKAYMTGSFPLTIETPDNIAMQVLNNLFYELPLEQLQNFRDRVNAVTVDDVQRVARAYLKPDRLSVALVGNASTFASQLKGVGFGEFETVELGDLDLTAADFKHAATKAGAVRRVGSNGERRLITYRALGQQSTTVHRDQNASALLDQMIAAKGGLDKLREIKSLTVAATMKMTTPTGGVNAESTTYLEYPNRFRVDTTLPTATIAQIFDGQHAWVRDPMGTHDVPDQGVREIEASLKRDTVAVLLAAHEGNLRARTLPDVRDASGATQQALEVSGPGLDPMVMYVAPSTHLITKQTYVTAGADQPVIEELFSDYRPVNGVQIAYAATVRRGGQVVLERRVTDIKINATLNPALFRRPGP